MSDFFKARCTEDGPGRYLLSYGKGSKKILGFVEQGKDRAWYVDAQGEHPYTTKREAVQAWAKQAASAYGTTQEKAAKALPPDVPPSADVPPCSQLAYLMSLSTPGVIQNIINEGPSRDDQLRRWFQAYLTTGQEFKLPDTTPGPAKGPPKFKPKETHEATEAPAGDPDQGIDVEATEVSGGAQADAPV